MLKKIAIHCITILAMPFAWCWVKWHEKRVLKRGESLSLRFYKFAERIEVKEVKKIRVLEVDRIPTPVPLFLQRFFQKLGFPVGNAIGMCMGHGIYIVKDYAHDDSLLSHELVHTLQYERLGGTWKFLHLYLFENLYYKYVNAPLEKEANTKAQWI